MRQVEHDEIKLRIGDMLFTWDDEKEKINIRKHGVDFKVAANIFLDKDAVVEYNSVDDYTGEERWDVVGMFQRIMLFVVYVERVTEDERDIIRIISARRQRERNAYYISMAISDYLDLAKTSEEREEMKQRLIALMEMKDEDIDFSDIPRITDFSRFVRGKPHFDKMRTHNRYVEEMRKRLAD